MSILLKARRLIVFLLVFGAVGLIAPIHAAENAPTSDLFSGPEWEGPQEDGAAPTDEPNLWVQTLRMLMGLAFILGLLGLGAWFLRRRAARGETGSRMDFIRIVASKMLGGRKSLLLVRVRGQTLLLGITPQSITFLTEMQEVESEWAQPPANPGQSSAGPGYPPANPGIKPSAFDRKLGAFIEKAVPDPPPAQE